MNGQYLQKPVVVVEATRWEPSSKDDVAVELMDCDCGEYRHQPGCPIGDEELP
jgi:hypothetical protein